MELKDAHEGVKITKQNLDKYGLPQNFSNTVMNGLLGTSAILGMLSKKPETIYSKLISDADRLDVYTIGRTHNFQTNILLKHMGDKYLRRSLTFLPSQTMNKNCYKELNFNTSRKVLKILNVTSFGFFNKFFPEMAKLVKERQMKHKITYQKDSGFYSPFTS